MVDENSVADINAFAEKPEVIVYGPPPDFVNVPDNTKEENNASVKTIDTDDASEEDTSEVSCGLPEKSIDEVSSDSDETADNSNEAFNSEHAETLSDNEKANKNENDIDFKSFSEDLKTVNERLDSICSNEQRLFSEVREMHKLYHSEFSGRLMKMQDELEGYRKIDKGRVFDEILEAIARIYGNSETLPDEVDDPKAKKNIKYILLDMEDLLNEYGVTKCRSSSGDKRNPKTCQILERIPTDDPDKHDTVAKSYNSGFCIGNRVIMKEKIDIYIFDGKTNTPEGYDEEINKNDNKK